ncbi:DUF1800 domain-containing protein [Roseateles sp. DAIF2]|uniref:DUF1800 domain-containing protein n=1 Tax=Roseateles sp. DAIF2 TaxID=2714952 RepID=UPI0018A25363|nr:DUF1800 domain-containing protein [Roseateles sp. DAIF2]QPF73334.1 DUF1800 domain-containing protein [Roseateles sp. DAIF2]
MNPSRSSTPDDLLLSPRPAEPALPPSALAPAALAALALSACGGGGGGSEEGASSNPSDTSPGTAPVAIGDAEAARFLAQAGFAASLADIATVKARGYSAWLDAQFALASNPSHADWLLAKGYGAESYKHSLAGVDNSLWRKWLSAPDQLRQRVVLALSEIFVISLGGLPTAWANFAAAAYVDMLEQRAFGTFRELLEGVSLSCGMGVYLNMRGNKKEDGKGSTPDENYAREVMQLFTIGLYELNPDGTPVLDAGGKPKESYSQANITELARVFTGWDFDGKSETDPSFMRRPMSHNAARFSSGAKKVLNVEIPATADGPAAMKTALDTLAAHANVGPFIGRQLIQRLVCSHPSPAYVRRVAAAFADNGRGLRGDLKAVIRAVLLDPEARSSGTGPSSGRLREPVQRFIQWGRSFGVTSPTELWNIGDTSNPANRLGQSPLRSPSVFNFFRPGYVPPNSSLGSNGITAPEFQLCNESTVAGYLNFMQGAIANGVGEVKPVYTEELALVEDAAALVERVALRLAGDGLAAATKATIATAVATIKTDTEARRLNRVQAAILLVMASPDYLIQK